VGRIEDDGYVQMRQEHGVALREGSIVKEGHLCLSGFSSPYLCLYDCDGEIGRGRERRCHIPAGPAVAPYTNKHITASSSFKNSSFRSALGANSFCVE
jgi:hypothetical protein